MARTETPSFNSSSIAFHRTVAAHHQVIQQLSDQGALQTPLGAAALMSLGVERWNSGYCQSALESFERAQHIRERTRQERNYAPPEGNSFGINTYSSSLSKLLSTV